MRNPRKKYSSAAACTGTSTTVTASPPTSNPHGPGPDPAPPKPGSPSEPTTINPTSPGSTSAAIGITVSASHHQRTRPVTDLTHPSERPPPARTPSPTAGNITAT